MTDTLGPGGRRPLQVVFADSFAHVFASSIAIVATAPVYEGLDQWAYVTFAALPDDLRRDIQLVFDPIGVPLILRELDSQAPDIQDFPSFIGWLSVIDDEAVRDTVAFIFRMLARKAASKGVEGLQVPSVDDVAGVREYLLNTDCEWTELANKDVDAFDRVVKLLVNPEQLKSRLVCAATRFWETVYRKQYGETAGLIRRSVAYHRQIGYTGQLSEIYLAITGKVLSPMVERAYASAGLERVTFIPSCHTGPYVRFAPLDDDGTGLALVFNARHQSADPNHPLASVQAIFPPLRALADETRLEILGILTDGELYAQQIVERLEISQPAVSRHLRLMVAGGILKERKESGMKFYSIRVDTLTDLTRRIAAFAAWGSD